MGEGMDADAEGEGEHMGVDAEGESEGTDADTEGEGDDMGVDAEGEGEGIDVDAEGEGEGTDAEDGNTFDIEVGDEMRQSFLDYAMSVITSRALPDVRDGLKPVHRRILWSMFNTGLRPNRPHKKCATVVGDVIANYHPHGDSSIYDALVRMGQHFSLANPLVDPHGNFGSPSDPPAAYRYTECRLTPLATALTESIDEQTVDFAANFDGSCTEPMVMPARFPNLLVNGSQGIAVGMATSIPTHNLTEVINATIHLIANPDATLAELMEFVPAPDFPTGGAIMGQAGALEAYQTGRGSIRMRGQAEIVEVRGGNRIVVTEIPYQTSVEGIETKIAELVKRKALMGIRAVRNESSKGQTRMVIELKNDAHPTVVLNQIYKLTPLQSNFPVNMLALRDGVPRTLTLREALVAYIDHQIEVVTRRSEYRLAMAKDRAHVVEGLLRALDLIDQIITAIRASADRASALLVLCGEELAFSEKQANHILDMQLSRLTRLGRSNLDDELLQLNAAITELEQILADDARLRSVIVDEMTELRDKHPTPRRSEILADEGDMEVEDLIKNEPLVVTLSAGGYLKAMSIDEFRTQGRGGRGVIGAKMAADDVPVRVLTTTTHSYLLFFTNRAKVYRVKAYRVTKSSRTARGTAVVNLLDLAPGETVQAMIDADHFNPRSHLTFVTRNGMVKRTDFTAYDKTRSKGLIALVLREGDELVRVLETASGDDLFVTTRMGQTTRFSLDEVRVMGRSSAGVRGMRLRSGDAVVAADAVAPGNDQDLFLVTDGGYGKRTALSAFTRKHRNILGVKGISLREDRGSHVVGARFVDEDDELLLVSSSGIMIRVKVSNISRQGRGASGVTVMSLGKGESVAAIALVGKGESVDEVGEAGGVDEVGVVGETGGVDEVGMTDEVDEVAPAELGASLESEYPDA